MRARTRAHVRKSFAGAFAGVFVGLPATALLAGCSDGEVTGGAVTLRGCNPQRPLIPADTMDSCGSSVLNLSASRLIRYHPQTAAPELDIAESIDTTDNQRFTVRLKPDYRFSDGTLVKARNFVDAWNYAVANALQTEYFFAPIQGYADVVPPPDPDGQGPLPAPPARSRTMSGLAVIDDRTFTITTTAKVSNLGVRLGSNAFAPMPDAFFSDPRAFGTKPIGAGPYVVTAWTQNQEIVLAKNPRYSGRFGGQVDSVTFKVFTGTDAAYNELVAGNLDVIDEIPTSAMAGGQYRQDLPGRHASREVGGIQLLVFPPATTDPTYNDPRVRQAISMAINRDLIVEQIFHGARTPADGWVSPIVNGATRGQCGEFCRYDAAAARALLAQAGGVPGGKVSIAYNADAAQQDSVTAICNEITNALGVECTPSPVADFATFRANIEARTQRGMLRSAWGMDYPSIESFLSPLYATGAAANVGEYRDPAFDAKLAQAAAAGTLDEANALYREAEAMLKDEMPAIPLWYSKVTYAWSTRVDNVRATPQGFIDVAGITLNRGPATGSG